MKGVALHGAHLVATSTSKLIAEQQAGVKGVSELGARAKVIATYDDVA